MRPLLSQAGFEAIQKSYEKVLARKDARAGSVSSIQTFGSYGANWHPHLHCLVTEGVFSPQGEFVALPQPGNTMGKEIEERFRRLLLRRLHGVERLSEEFMSRLLQWSPSGFWVFPDGHSERSPRQRLWRQHRYPGSKVSKLIWRRSPPSVPTSLRHFAP